MILSSGGMLPPVNGCMILSYVLYQPEMACDEVGNLMRRGPPGYHDQIPYLLLCKAKKRSSCAT